MKDFGNRAYCVTPVEPRGKIEKLCSFLNCCCSFDVLALFFFSFCDQVFSNFLTTSKNTTLVALTRVVLVVLISSLSYKVVLILISNVYAAVLTNLLHDLLAAFPIALT